MGIFSGIIKWFNTPFPHSDNTVEFKENSSPFDDFVVIDVETTGLSAYKDKVIQVAAVRYIHHKMSGRFASYVNPGRSIPKEASRINGITNDMVRSAPKFEAIQDKYFSFVKRSPLVVGYNVKFDLQFLSAESGMDLFSAWRHVDVLSLAREALPMLPNYKLSTVSQHIGFNANFHDALADCRACGQVLNYLCSKGLISIEYILDTLEPSTPVSQPVQKSAYSNPYIECELSDEDFETAYGLWSQGEEKRINGDIEAALHLFDSAHEMGYTAPVIYESYAKAYRKLRDYEKEISILDEAISHSSGPIADSFLHRKTRAEELMLAQQRREAAIAQRVLERKRKAELRRKRQEMEATKPKKSGKRAVIQYADDGRIIKEFESVSSAAKELGITPKGIRDAASGRQKHAGGFCWRYASPDIATCDIQQTVSTSSINSDNPFLEKI